MEVRQFSGRKGSEAAGMVVVVTTCGSDEAFQQAIGVVGWFRNGIVLCVVICGIGRDAADD